MGRRVLSVVLAIAVWVAARAAAADAAPGWEAAWDQRIAEARALRPWIAAAAAAAVAAGWAARRRGGLPLVERGRDALLVALSLATLFTWWHPHQGALRTWHHVADSFHYYLGSKYFQELGYTRLYRCAVVADAEAGLGSRVARQEIRNLETNGPESALAVLRNPGECRDHFTEARWREFSADLAWYRSQVDLPFWLSLRGDHGYNPPPTWTMVGSLLTNTGPAGPTQIVALTLIDPALLAAMFGVIAWAFGWRVTCIALVYWGTNQPASWEWVGGSILRFDWLLASAAAICCLRRGRPVAAGLLLAWAAAVRIFPVAIVAGLGLGSVIRMAQARRLGPTDAQRRFAAAFATGVAAIAALSSVVVGPESWIAFARNSRTHVATDTLNRVGLRPMLAYRHGARASVEVDASLPDPYARWREAREATFASRRPLMVLLAAGYLVLLVLALRRQPDWAAAVLGVGMLPFLLELGCYYYGLLLVFACLWPEREDVATGLLLTASATWWVGTWSGPDRDLVSAWTSGVILVFVLFATARLLRPLGSAAHDPVPRLSR